MVLQQPAFRGGRRRHPTPVALWPTVLALGLSALCAIPGTAADEDPAQAGDDAAVAGEAPPSQDAAPQPEPEIPAEDRYDAPPAGVEVLRVRGRGVAEIATDVPASVTQFDPQEIAALGAQNVGDLARVTPNLEIKTLTATSPTFFIRGVGLNDFSANAAGAVAIYRDGVPLNAPAIQLGQLFDIEGVEILRGPEGFDDNRNASGGAIRSNSRKPTGNYEASLRADRARFDSGEISQDYEGALSLPIVQDWLSARGAFRITSREPFVENRCGKVIDPGDLLGPQNNACFETLTVQNSTASLIRPGLPKEVNDRNRWAGRTLFRLTPPESDTDWLLNIHGGVLDEDTQLGQVLGVDRGQFVGGIPGAPGTATGYVDPKVQAIFERNIAENPQLPGERPAAWIGRINAQTLKPLVRDIGKTDPFEGSYDTVGNEKLTSWGTSLTGEFSIGEVRVKSITGYEDFWRRRLGDFDYSPNPVVTSQIKDGGWQATQNLSFEYEPDWMRGRLRWGGYYLREELSSDSFLQLFLVNLSEPTGTFLEWEQILDSAGIFGNFSWDFLDDFTLDGGLRMNYEGKDFETAALPEVSFARGVDSRSAVVDKSWNALTGGLGLTYYFTHDITAYFKYTRGWKAGHIQANARRSLATGGEELETPVPDLAEPETIDAFEVGMQGKWFDERLQLGGSAFLYSYQDYQVFVVESRVGSNPQLKIINADDARVFGAEADFRIEPLRGWVPRILEGFSVSGRIGWLESEFLDFTDERSTRFVSQESGISFVLTQIADFSGNRLPNTPRFKVSGTVEYVFDLSRWGTLGIRWDVNWTDDIYFDPTEGRGVKLLTLGGAVGGLPEYSIGQKAYTLHDLRAFYRVPNSHVEIAGFVRNLKDVKYKTFVQDQSAQAFRSLQNLIGEPRIYGFSISVFY